MISYLLIMHVHYWETCICVIVFLVFKIAFTRVVFYDALGSSTQFLLFVFVLLSLIDLSKSRG